MACVGKLVVIDHPGELIMTNIMVMAKWLVELEVMILVKNEARNGYGI